MFYFDLKKSETHIQMHYLSLDMGYVEQISNLLLIKLYDKIAKHVTSEDWQYITIVIKNKTQ